MRKLLIGLIIVSVVGFPIACAAAGQYRDNVKLERKALKTRQKQEWKILNLQQKNQKRSWKGMRMSRAARGQMKHELERQRRALRESQRNDRQALKDRQRLMKERTRGTY